MNWKSRNILSAISAASALSAVVLAILPLAGCDDRPTATVPAPAPAKATVAPSGDSTISGRIFLHGKIPLLKPIDVSGVADCARLHPDGIPDEAIVVAPDGGLQNVIVYLRGVVPDSGGPGRPPVVLDQVGCQYRPHVIALQTGQTLRVESQDPFMHNVHIKSTANAASNFSQLAENGTPALTDTRFGIPEIFPIQCDVHPWMRAWVGVFDHPYYAVTDANGAFRIERVPPGSFTVVAWHERFGEITAPLGITEKMNATIDLTYAH